MKKLVIFLSIFILNFLQMAFAIDYEGIYDNSKIVYSPSFILWSQNALERDDITFTKQIFHNCSYYISDYRSVCLNSKFELIIDGRLICVDNDNLKYYEVSYIENEFVQLPLNYEELQKIFSDTYVIKISDFKNGDYTIINHLEGKNILLMNDTDKKFNNYTVSPIEYSVSNDIKGLLKLPKRGKITISNIENNNDKKYVIRVR